MDDTTQLAPPTDSAPPTEVAHVEHTDELAARRADAEALSTPPSPEGSPASEPVSWHQMIPLGERVAYCFEDHEGFKRRPAFIVEAHAEALDLFVMFSPHDRINGMNATPCVILGVKHAGHSSVTDDVFRRCWTPSHGG